MINIPEENIRCFIEHDPIGICKTPKVLWSIFLLYNIIAIPTALLGRYASVTRTLLLPVSVVLGIWLIYLSLGLTKKKAGCLLYTGVLYTFISLASLLAAYKFLSMITTQVHPSAIVVVIAVYFVVTLLMIPGVKKLVTQGFYNGPKKPKDTLLGTGLAGGVLALTITRFMIGHISRYAAGQIVIFGLLVLSFFCVMLEIIFYNRYYYLRRMIRKGTAELMK